MKLFLLLKAIRRRNITKICIHCYMKYGGLAWVLGGTGKKWINWMCRHLRIFVQVPDGEGMRCWGETKLLKHCFKSWKKKAKKKGQKKTEYGQGLGMLASLINRQDASIYGNRNKFHKAYSPTAQLLLSKQIPWAGDIFLEGVCMARIFLLSPWSPKSPKPKNHTHTQKTNWRRWRPKWNMILIL